MKLKTIRIMLEKTKKALKEELSNSSNLSCDPVPTPFVGIARCAKALKEDLNEVKDCLQR